MTILLSDGTTTVELHEDLFWSDELAWDPVAQTAQRGITGALIVSSAQMLAGRPITLEPENDSSAWMHRDDVLALRNWAAVAGQELTLTLRGVTHTVLFRHQDGGLEARPVVHYNEADNHDWYLCVVRLMEI